MPAKTCLIGMLLLALPVSVCADGDSDARALVRRVIRAKGGEARLRRLSAATWQVAAIDHTQSRKVEYTASVASAPGRTRIYVRGERRGTPFARTLVLDGDRGWLDTDGTRADLAAAALAEERERLHANELATLVSLLDRDNRLSLLEEKRVGEHLAVGLRVERDGRREVRLYFDKETDLLLAVESTVHDPATGRDVTQEVRYSDVRTVDGIKQAMKFAVRWNHHKVAEGTCSDYKFLEKLPETLFTKP
jgi:hypothetical protein